MVYDKIHQMHDRAVGFKSTFLRFPLFVLPRDTKTMVGKALLPGGLWNESYIKKCHRTRER